MKNSSFKLAFNKSFLIPLALTAVPVALQIIMSSTRTLVDVLMTSRLGTQEVAAIGYGSRILFVVILAIIGMANGGGVLIAQFWGNKQKKQAKYALAATFLIALLISLVIYLVCFFGAELMVSAATKDKRVILLSSSYIRIASAMIIPLVIISSFGAGLRSIGLARVNTICTALGVMLNIALNYALIFGHWGCPALGVAGAAWATLISAAVEALLLLLYIFITSSPMAVKPVDFVEGLRSHILSKIVKIGLPISISSVTWAVGILVYNILVGRMGTKELATLALISPVESIAIALYVGVARGAGVLVGHSLGDNLKEKAWLQSKAILVWITIVGISSCILIFITKDLVLSFYSGIDEETLGLARRLLIILSCAIFFRAFNVTIIVGLMRAGGDTVFTLGTDVFCQWGVGIILTYLTAFVWKYPLPIVFLAINSEEFVKFFICSYRYISQKWMRNLVSQNQMKVKPDSAVS